MWLFVGLGNPGSRYDRTPHNLGFDVVDLLVERHGLAWQDTRRFKCVAAAGSFQGEKIFFMKPMTYMNISGDAAQPFADYYKIPNENILAITDDVNLPWGKIRLRAKGSAGGHNGLKSLIQRLGGDDFPRLRLGCQPEGPSGDMKSYVLSPVWGDAAELAPIVREKAADCIESILEDGFSKTMAVYNGWDARKENAD